MVADSLRFPILYQSIGRSALKPFPIRIDSAGTVDIDIQSYSGGQKGSMTFKFMSYNAEPITFAASGGMSRGHKVLVNGTEQESRQAGGSLVFAVNADAIASYLAEVLPA